jgi:type I site-specific restriction endonuclease
LLGTQLALLRSDRQFAGLKKTIIEIASELELVRNIPMVAAELALILELQTDEYWQDVTVPMLEPVRRRLRSLVKLIELRSAQSSSRISRMRSAPAQRCKSAGFPLAPIWSVGVAGVFGEGEVVQLIKILEEVQGRAAA